MRVTQSIRPPYGGSIESSTGSSAWFISMHFIVPHIARLEGTFGRVSPITSLPHDWPESRDRDAGRVRGSELASRTHLLLATPIGFAGPYPLGYLSGDSGWPLLVGLGANYATHRRTLCNGSAACGTSH